MYSTPDGYNDIADDPFRGENVYMSMGFFIDNTAADDVSSIAGEDSLPMSNNTQLTNARYSVIPGLAVYEADGIPTELSAGMVVPPLTANTSMETGIWSEGISDGEGNIDWSFTISLSSVHVSGLSVYTSGPRILEGYAEFSNNGQTVSEELLPLAECAVASDNFTYDSITVHITKIDSPYSHVRIAEIEFGNSVTIGVDELANRVTFIDEMDPLQIGMPLQELDFDLINISGDYDEDKPGSLFSRLAIGNPINLSYTLGKEGVQMTVPMGRFMIGEKNSKNDCVSVVAYDVRWKLSQMFNPWSIDTSVSLGTSLHDLITGLDLDCDVDQAVYSIYPLTSYQFTNDTSVLSDIHLVAQAYGLRIMPDRNGVIRIMTDIPSDDYGTLPIQNQITWAEASQTSRYNYIDIGYNNNTQHYSLDLRVSPNVARMPISIYNKLISTEAQAIAVANRIASHLYTKSVKVKWLADPAMDLYDTVKVYSQWTAEGETPPTFRPIKREITYDGILIDETTFIQ